MRAVIRVTLALEQQAFFSFLIWTVISWWVTVFAQDFSSGSGIDSGWKTCFLSETWSQNEIWNAILNDSWKESLTSAWTNTTTATKKELAENQLKRHIDTEWKVFRPVRADLQTHITKPCSLQIQSGQTRNAQTNVPLSCFQNTWRENRLFPDSQSTEWITSYVAWLVSKHVPLAGNDSSLRSNEHLQYMAKLVKSAAE